LVEDELVKIIDKKRVVYPQHNFKTIDVTLVNQRLEICIGKHANSNLESEAFIFTYEYNSKKIIIQKLLKELPIALEEISIQTIGLLEKRKAIIKNYCLNILRKITK
jgi:hypothetical protein